MPKYQPNTTAAAATSLYRVFDLSSFLSSAVKTVGAMERLIVGSDSDPPSVIWQSDSGHSLPPLSEEGYEVLRRS